MKKYDDEDKKDHPSANNSNKWGSSKKWIAIIFIVLCLFVMSRIMFNQMESNEFATTRPSSDSDRYTIVINTFKRLDLVQDAVKHYSKCSKVGYIYIVWSEHEPPPEKLRLKYAKTTLPVVAFDVHETDSLNNRFKPLKGPHTDGIFSVDDDMRVPCQELDFAFDVWQSSRDSLVGFMPRVHVRGAQGNLVYRCWWKVWWLGSFSIILTKAAFLHHRFFDTYTNQMPETIRKYVDDNRNCEDIAMQFLVANATSRPPIYIKGHLTDLGALGGISTSQNVAKAAHMDARSDCLNDLVTLFNRNPLVNSKIIVDSATNRWNNAPSTWWEYISSDLWNFF